jgi:oligopeptide/dipeptide ABC transporter ATP-binding protein
METLVEVKDLKKYFPTKGTRDKKVSYVHAVDGVSFQIKRGETFGLVGESGCGKSTLGRTIIRLQSSSEGSIYFKGENITRLSDQQLGPIRRQMQIIFQDPYSSLNPRRCVFDIVKAPLDNLADLTGGQKDAAVLRILEKVGIPTSSYDKYPNEMSGGQRQRVSIARALVTNPDFIVCDEPVSALDVSVRSQVLNLMKDLQAEFDLSYLFISHDLSVVKYLCDTIAVMYLGEIIEVANKEELFKNPLHPYTQALISSIPVPDIHAQREKIILTGDVPSPIDPPAGCRFHPRCPYAGPDCAKVRPAQVYVNDHHAVSCHLRQSARLGEVSNF